MSKFLAQSKDTYGNVTYVAGINENDVEFSTDVRKAILLASDDKKVINKLCKKHNRFNPTYIKLEKFDSINLMAYSYLNEYEHNFMSDIAKFARKQDEVSLECIELAKTELNVRTFDEFSNQAAKLIVEKYNLKKK